MHAGDPATTTISIISALIYVRVREYMRVCGHIRACMEINQLCHLQTYMICVCAHICARARIYVRVWAYTCACGHIRASMEINQLSRLHICDSCKVLKYPGHIAHIVRNVLEEFEHFF